MDEDVMVLDLSDLDMGAPAEDLADQMAREYWDAWLTARGLARRGAL